MRWRCCGTGSAAAELPTSPSGPGLREWPLEEKRAEIERVLATMPEEQEMAANYQQWASSLSAPWGRALSRRAIMAEAEAARIIAEWEAACRSFGCADLLNRSDSSYARRMSCARSAR